MGDELNNSEEFSNQAGEQSEETRNEEPSEQTGVDSDEDQFYASNIEDINRDDLSPQMQAVYDRLLEERSNMQAGFTRSMQEAAAVRRDADVWRSVQQHPELLRVMNDAIYRMNNSQPINNTQAQQPAEMPDPAQDPMGAIRAVVNEVVSEALGQYMPGLQQGIQQVTGFVQKNQAQLEFDNLCNTYPAAKSVGFQAIDEMRNQYRDSYGRPISMADAFTLLARDNPRLLQQKTVPLQQARPKAKPVERPAQRSGGQVPVQVPTGVRDLRARMDAQRKSGVLGNLSAVVDAALAKFQR